MALKAFTKAKTLSKTLKSCNLNKLRAIASVCYSTASAAATAPAADARRGDLGLWGVDKEYEEYRKSVYGGDVNYKALLVDAVGTLVVPSQPMAQVVLYFCLLNISSFYIVVDLLYHWIWIEVLKTRFLYCAI